MTKTYRLYFHRKADAPYCWCIDEGSADTEIYVTELRLINASLFSQLNLSADNLHEPRAWFETHGTLHLSHGHASITGATIAAL